MTKWFLILAALLFINCAESGIDYENDQDVYNEYNYYDEGGNMSVDLKNDATLTGRIVITDTEYPDGKYKDADLDGGGAPVPGTGTPFRAKERADIAGFLGALLGLGNLTPSGLADAPNPTTPADRGQYLKALTNWFLDEGLLIKATTPTTTSPSSGLLPGNLGATVFPLGATTPLISSLQNGGVSFFGWIGDSSTVWSAEAEFNIDLTDLSLASGILTYTPGGGLEMIGIKSTSRAIISCDLLLREDGTSQAVVPMSTVFLEGFTYLKLNFADGYLGIGALPAYSSGILRIRYDPRFVEQP